MNCHNEERHAVQGRNVLCKDISGTRNCVQGLKGGVFMTSETVASVRVTLFNRRVCCSPAGWNCKNLNKILSTLLKYVGTWVFLGTNHFKDLETFINSEAAEGF